MTKRLHEAGTISLDASGTKYRVCLISEGKGSSATFTREFFISENADALAGSLSFPGHPEHTWAPENRNPLTVIGKIGPSVTIEESEGRMGFWSEYIPAKSRPDIAPYLAEYGQDLGLSIYIESEGFVDDVTGLYVATKLRADDPYKSVDLVVAAGAGGKFDRVAEGLRRITEASATAEEKEVTRMDKDIEQKFDGLTTIVERLVSALEGKAKADLQVEADASAVVKAVESRLTDYDKAVDLITEAKLTESQSTSLRALAKEGVDVAPHIESAKKVLTEAKALVGTAPETQTVVENRLGGGDSQKAGSFNVSGFGKVS